MKILLLGGTGFVGSHLCAALIKTGYTVVVISRNKPVVPVDSVEYLTGGLESSHLLDQLLKTCSHVIHLASATTPGGSHLKPSQEVFGNLVPMARLLECLQRTPQVNLIFLSSGGAIYGDQPLESVKEQTAISPKSYYGAGKAAIETFLRAYQAQTGHGVTVIRPSNLYGPGQSRKAGFGIVPTLFDCARSREPLELWADGETIRDYLYVDDFVDLCLSSLTWSAGRKDFSVFNAGSGRGYSLNQLRDSVSAVSGIEIEVIQHPSRGIDVRRIVLDPSAAMQELGWRPRTPLEKGLELAWQWYQTQPPGERR